MEKEKRQVQLGRKDYMEAGYAGQWESKCGSMSESIYTSDCQSEKGNPQPVNDVPDNEDVVEDAAYQDRAACGGDKDLSIYGSERQAMLQKATGNARASLDMARSTYDDCEWPAGADWKR